jgi:drug/metabolite transporter (DMT)-like permease
MVEMSRHLAVHRDPCAAAAAQFLLAALLTLPLGAAWGDLSWEGAAAAAPELAMLGAVVTAGAFGAQAVALRFTTSGHAAVILSAESAFGAVAAALVLGERMTPVQAVGAALVLGAILALARAATRAERAAERAAARA